VSDTDIQMASHTVTEDQNAVSDAPGSAGAQDPRLLAAIEIAAILAADYDLETMLSRFLSCLTETWEAAEYGILYLYNPENDTLEAGAAQRYHPSYLRQMRLAPGEGTCGKAFMFGEPELFPTLESIEAARENMSEENRTLLDAAMAGKPPAQSCVAVPLKTGTANVGVLKLENVRRPDSFSQADLPFLQALAGLIAQSIENAMLKEQLQVTEALREANRLKTELIATLSHEMRTPLTSIKGYSTALLMDELSFDPDTQREFLEIIDDECDILQDLIHDLLESSIIDSGLLRLEFQPVRLPRLVNEVVQDITRRSKIHQIVSTFPEEFPLLDADPLRVAQVLRNLLDNAVKYSPHGGLIVVRGEASDDEVVVSVADQGVGLAPEHVNRLFEIGFRVKSGLIRHVAGSGLGLPICRTIVESHGGRIWAESKLAHGTTLFFALPIRNSDQKPLRQREI
jgi:signal transduction histidine kinase